MLPNLNRLALAPTGGMLGNAQWPEDEVCSICTFPLARPSEDERYAWPFSGDGTGFTAVACIQGHAFHKGCLRFMQRFDDARCPDCRKPMFAEVLTNVSRPDQEQIEREQRQAAEREQARAEREREDREREQRRRNPPAAGPSNVSIADQRIAQLRLEAMGYERGEPGPQSPDDYFAMWTFVVKGFVLHSVLDRMRHHFHNHLRTQRMSSNLGSSSWNRRLAIDMQWLEPRREATGAEEPMTLLRCKLFLPERLIVSFVVWFRGAVVEYGYAPAIRRILGIGTAKRWGSETITNMGALDDHDAHEVGEAGQEGFSMTAEEYAEWPAWDFRTEGQSDLGAPVDALVEFEDPQSAADFAVQWTLLIKAHIPTRARIWMAVRYFFDEYMHREWPATFEPVESWGRGLGIALRHGNVAPISATHASMRIEFTRCRFRMHLPEAAARRFAEWLRTRIHTQSYGQAMEEVLGIKGAIKAGPAHGATIALIPGYSSAVTPETENVLQVHEFSTPAMTWREYQAWPHFEYNASFEAPEPALAPPQGQADWMYEEAMAEMRESDPITNFHPPGGDDTDVTIRWRFWLKGPMSEFDREHTPTHWRRAFADKMRDAEGLPELRTSADPWFDRLWVWTREEQPRITWPRRPRSGQRFVSVQRCEFALKLPRDVASAWMTLVAQAFGSISWDHLAQTWFYVEPVRSNAAGVDKPQVDPPGATLHPLVGAPTMTEGEYNAWGTWRSIQRFFAIGESR